MNIRLILSGLFAFAALCATAALARGQLFVMSAYNSNGEANSGTIGEYTLSGAPVNPALISGLNFPTAITVSGGNLFVATQDPTQTFTVISEYTTSGTLVNSSLISGLSSVAGIAVSGGNLFLTHNFAGTIGKYTTSGMTVDAALVSGLNDPIPIATDGDNLFVGDTAVDTLHKYTTSGTPVNDIHIPSPLGIALSGENLFVSTFVFGGGNGTIGEYTTSLATVNSALISGLGSNGAIAVSGNNLFVSFNGTVAEYTTSGETVNAALISGLTALGGIAVATQPVPDLSSMWMLLLLGLTAVFGFRLFLCRQT